MLGCGLGDQGAKCSAGGSPVARLGILRQLVAVSKSIGGGETVLEGSLSDNLHSPVVGLQFLERSMGLALADAAGAEALVEPLGDD